MSTSARIVDMADLLKLLTQSTEATAPDNPAEVLNDFASGTDTMPLSDAVAFPNLFHNGTYHWGDAASLWNKSQWS